MPPSEASRMGQALRTTCSQTLDLGTGQYSEARLPGIEFYSAFYSFLKLGGHLLGLKGRFSLDITEYEVVKG